MPGPGRDSERERERERERELDERKGADHRNVGLVQFRLLRLIRADGEARAWKPTLRTLHPRVRLYDREPESSTAVALTILVDRGLLASGTTRAQARTWSLTARGRAILEQCEQRTLRDGGWAYDHADRVAAGEHPPRGART